MQKKIALVALSTLIIGPALNYAAAIVRFGVGTVSHWDLTLYAPVTLAIGVPGGAIAGCMAAFTDLRPFDCAWRVGAIMLVLLAAMIAVAAHLNSAPFLSTINMIDLALMTIGTALTGFLAVVAKDSFFARMQADERP